jgi:hypothetical protein
VNQISITNLPERYFFVDPASGRDAQKLKRVRARSAIVGVAPDHLGRCFVLVAWADRVSPEALVNQICAHCEAWKPTAFGIEANAMQSLFADLVIREARRRGIGTPFLPIDQPTHLEKDWRIRTTIQPVLGAGRLFVPDSLLDLKMELASFPMSPTKDLVDALASALAMVPPRVPRQREDDERAELAAYLRASGAPPSVIARRMQEWELVEVGG